MAGVQSGTWQHFLDAQQVGFGLAPAAHRGDQVLVFQRQRAQVVSRLSQIDLPGQLIGIRPEDLVQGADHEALHRTQPPLPRRLGRCLRNGSRHGRRCRR